jgi:hypothetical protein
MIAIPRLTSNRHLRPTGGNIIGIISTLTCPFKVCTYGKPSSVAPSIKYTTASVCQYVEAPIKYLMKIISQVKITAPTIARAATTPKNLETLLTRLIKDLISIPIKSTRP